MSLVVDASVLVAYLVADDPRRPRVVERLGAGDLLLAPSHMDVEVLSALRGLAMTSPWLQREVPRLLVELSALPIQRVPLSPLLGRAWQLRANLTAYDAAYVALGEAAAASVLTCDGKLAAADVALCPVELIG